MVQARKCSDLHRYPQLMHQRQAVFVEWVPGELRRHPEWVHRVFPAAPQVQPEAVPFCWLQLHLSARNGCYYIRSTTNLFRGTAGPVQQPRPRARLCGGSGGPGCWQCDPRSLQAPGKTDRRWTGAVVGRYVVLCLGRAWGFIFYARVRGASPLPGSAGSWKRLLLCPAIR